MGPVKKRTSADDLLPSGRKKSLKNVKSSPGIIQRLGVSDNRQSLAVQINRRASAISQNLAVPDQGKSNKQRSSSQASPNKPRNFSIASGGSVGSAGSSGGSYDGSDSRVRRRNRHKKNKKDNILTRIWDYMAVSDVFNEKNQTAPYVTCIYLTVIAIPVFFTLLLWDTLTVSLFEIPHLSTIDQPAFILEFQFITLLISMYGYCIQILKQKVSRQASLAKVSIAFHSLLFFWRIFIELYYDGYRGQDKHYIPKTDDAAD